MPFIGPPLFDVVLQHARRCNVRQFRLCRDVTAYTTKPFSHHLRQLVQRRKLKNRQEKTANFSRSVNFIIQAGLNCRRESKTASTATASADRSTKMSWQLKQTAVILSKRGLIPILCNPSQKCWVCLKSSRCQSECLLVRKSGCWPPPTTSVHTRRRESLIVRGTPPSQA